MRTEVWGDREFQNGAWRLTNHRICGQDGDIGRLVQNASQYKKGGFKMVDFLKRLLKKRLKNPKSVGYHISHNGSTYVKRLYVG